MMHHEFYFSELHLHLFALQVMFFCFCEKKVTAYKETFLNLPRNEKVSALINILSGGFLLSINWVLHDT